MSTSPDRPLREIEQLHTRTRNLRHVVTHKLATARKKHRNLVILGAGLVVVSVAALGNVTRMALALDAKALAEIGRARIECSLPAGRESLQAYLRTEAPAVTRSFIDGVTNSIPSLRTLVLEQISVQAPVIASEFEERLIADMRDALVTSKAEIDAEMPNSTDAERAARLVEMVTTRFQENALEAFHSLYPEYAGQVDRIVLYLERLRSKPEAELTRKEQTHKEIITTILRLALHAHEHQKDGGYDF